MREKTMSSFKKNILLLVAVAFYATANSPEALAVFYRVRFDATWSSDTHPGAYPASAHFSSLIGTTHNDQVTFWETGGLATEGIETMAEFGGTSDLKDEFNAAGANADTLITGSGIVSPGAISRTFDVSSTHSLVTLVTMIAPSPDWFVGVSSLDLRSGSSWIPEIVVDLYAYDAGTDSGVNFIGPDIDTNPQEPIALLGAPLAGTPALGTFTFSLLGDFDHNGLIDGNDFLKWQRGETTPPYDPKDYDDWQMNFGNPSAAIAAAIIPEPTTGILALLSISILLPRRQRH